MPQDGHWIASFEFIPLPKKVSFSAAKKMKIPHCECHWHWKRDAHAHFLKKSHTHFFSSSFSAVFIGNSVTPMSTLANNKRSCSKKWKNQAKIAFFLIFFRRKFWYDFVTPFSTFANIKGSLPTNSTTPDRLRCRARPSDEDFPGFWPMIFSKIAKKKFFFRARHLLVLNFWSTVYTPKEARSRIFVTGGQYSRDKCWRKKIVFRGGNSSYTGWGWSLCPTQRILETRASGTVTRIHIDTVNTVVWSRHRFNMY